MLKKTNTIKIAIFILTLILLCLYKGFVNNKNFTGSGYAKIILFNEHFVVYGSPAIAASIPNKKITTTIIPSNRLSIYPKKVRSEIIAAIKRIFKLLNINEKKAKFSIAFTGNIPKASGIGSSSALAVATTKAVSNYLNLDLSTEKINAIAFESEKNFHNNPSGIDNTISTYHGLIRF